MRPLTSALRDQLGYQLLFFLHAMMTFQNILTIYNAAGILEVSAFNYVSRPSVHRQHFGPVSQLLMPLLPVWWQSNNAHQCHVCTFYSKAIFQCWTSNWNSSHDTSILFSVYSKRHCVKFGFLTPSVGNWSSSASSSSAEETTRARLALRADSFCTAKKINHRIRSTTSLSYYLC